MSSPFALDPDFLNSILHSSPKDCWEMIQKKVWEIMSAPIDSVSPDLEISHRDRAVGQIDSALLSSWEIWKDFSDSTERGTDSIKMFWNDDNSGKAVLILDALSLRESPWLIDGVKKRGLKIESAKPVSSELPPETTEFAKALGFNQRSSLSESTTSATHILSDAKTFSCNLPWNDCANLIGSERNLIFWHHWPDSRMHDLSDPGDGFQRLVKESNDIFKSDDFWNFVMTLSTGRKLLITSDHGYAASGLFKDVSNKEQSKYLKEKYKSGRSQVGNQLSNSWVPPIEIVLKNKHGERTYVLGRKKWKSSGGYPTLLHGGLTLLEVFSPQIIIQGN